MKSPGTIIRNHPLARGLVFLGGPSGDLVTRQGPWSARGSAQMSPTPYGPGLESTLTTGGGFACPWSAEALVGSTQHTISVWASITAWNFFSGLVAISKLDEAWGTTGPRAALYVTASSTTTAYSSWHNSIGGEAFATSGAGFFVTDGSWHHYVTTRVAGNASFYRDGKFFTSSAANGGTPAVGYPSGTGYKVHVFNIPATPNSSAVGKAVAPSIWNRALLPNEVSDLYVNPFCMLRR